MNIDEVKTALAAMTISPEDTFRVLQTISALANDVSRSQRPGISLSARSR
jgi:hypothetical protein